jgi:hypothetical protein
MACTTALRDLDTLAYDYELRGVTGVPLQICEGRLSTSRPQCGKNLNYGMYHSFGRVYVSLPPGRGLLWPLLFTLCLRFSFVTSPTAHCTFCNNSLCHRSSKPDRLEVVYQWVQVLSWSFAEILAGDSMM